MSISPVGRAPPPATRVVHTLSSTDQHCSPTRPLRLLLPAQNRSFHMPHPRHRERPRKFHCQLAIGECAPVPCRTSQRQLCAFMARVASSTASVLCHAARSSCGLLPVSAPLFLSAISALRSSRARRAAHPPASEATPPQPSPFARSPPRSPRWKVGRRPAQAPS